jgi:hypothetical protein
MTKKFGHSRFIAGQFYLFALADKVADSMRFDGRN